MDVIYNENKLIQRLKNGETLAFDLIFKQYKDRLYAFALKLTHSQVEAEGIIQETFIRLWLNHSSLKEEYSLKSYLFTITRNLILDYFKKKNQYHLLADYFQHVQDDLIQHGSDALVLKEYEEEIKHHIQKLPKKRRIIFVLSRKFGLSHKEIAHYLGISENTVKNQIQLALDYLRIHVKIFSFPLIYCVLQNF